MSVGPIYDHSARLASRGYRFGRRKDILKMKIRVTLKFNSRRDIRIHMRHSQPRHPHRSIPLPPMYLPPPPLPAGADLSTPWTAKKEKEQTRQVVLRDLEIFRESACSHGPISCARACPHGSATLTTNSKGTRNPLLFLRGADVRTLEAGSEEEVYTSKNEKMRRRGTEHCEYPLRRASSRAGHVCICVSGTAPKLPAL